MKGSAPKASAIARAVPSFGAQMNTSPLASAPTLDKLASAKFLAIANPRPTPATFGLSLFCRSNEPKILFKCCFHISFALNRVFCL